MGFVRVRSGSLYVLFTDTGSVEGFWISGGDLSRFADFRATCLHGKPLKRTTYTSQHGSGVS